MGESISACQLLLHLTHVGNICCTWHTAWCNNAAQVSSQWTLHRTDLDSAATLCQTGRNIHTNEVQQFPADVLFNVIITCQVRLRWLCDAALPGCDCVNRVTHQVVTDDESVLHEFSSSSRLETKKQKKFHHEEHVARICITTSPQISQYTAVIIRNKVEISLTV